MGITKERRVLALKLVRSKSKSKAHLHRVPRKRKFQMINQKNINKSALMEELQLMMKDNKII